LRTLAAVVLAIGLAFPATAAANDFQNVYREYKRTGTIKPCRFSDKQLANAEKQTPPDVEQYAPSFLDALQAARERNADCGKKPAATAPPAQETPTTPSAAPPTPSTPTPAPPATTTTPAATTPPPAPPNPAQAKVTGVPSPPIHQAKQDDTAPAAVWLLAGLGAVAVLCAVFAGLAWWFGWSAGWSTGPSRASWSDFGEWLSTGQ
jgi:hypothetical protein